MTTETTIENYCIDCKSVALPDCEQRGHIVGTLGHVDEQPSHEQPASATENEQSQLFPRYSFAVVTGRYKILDNRAEGTPKFPQIATADGEQEARIIVNALNADVQYLANRAEELSSLLAGMTTERDRLQQQLVDARAELDLFLFGNAYQARRENLLKLRRQIDNTLALNHAGQGEGS